MFKMTPVRSREFNWRYFSPDAGLCLHQQSVLPMKYPLFKIVNDLCSFAEKSIASMPTMIRNLILINTKATC